jgi:bifunctional ADP-heptose synthase (sugar kinase/adenylyltransferase)
MEKLPETALMQTWGGTALALPFVAGYSTTALLQKIRAQ